MKNISVFVGILLCVWLIQFGTDAQYFSKSEATTVGRIGRRSTSISPLAAALDRTTNHRHNRYYLILRTHIDDLKNGLVRKKSAQSYSKNYKIAFN